MDGASELESKHSLLQWIEPLGMGYVDPGPFACNYDQNYWGNYRRLDRTEMGRKLTEARYELVKRFNTKNRPVCDIGIGGGAFVERCDGLGFDINPHAVEWLKQRGKFVHEGLSVPVATYWDSLEHIHDIEGELSRVSNICFVSMPIYENREHVLKSKHFKPGEHIWYFTNDGFINFMRKNGFELIKFNFMESELGREDIETFVFYRTQTA